MPAAPVGGTPGFFTGGNPGTGTPASVPGYEWFNGVQEELIGLILRGGITASDADLAQVRKSLDRLFGGGLASLSANTTLTVDDAGLVLVDASGGARIITLPAASAMNARPIPIRVVKIDASANAVTVQRAGTDLIEATTSIVLSNQWASVALVSNGVNNWLSFMTAGRLINVQVFSTQGTQVYTPTPGTSWVIAEVQAGGGAGGGAPATGVGQGSVGGAGCSGGYGLGRFLSGFAGVNVTVGAGGTPNAGSSGSNGGSSSFGALLTAPGGPGGGISGPGTPPLMVGVFPATGPSGANLGGGPGQAGQISTQHTTTLGGGGAGGASRYGGGGAQQPSGSDGVAATAPGSAGGGTANSQSFALRNGGAGAPGRVTIWEYS
jgi:hypothetical protein